MPQLLGDMELLNEVHEVMCLYKYFINKNALIKGLETLLTDPHHPAMPK